MTTTDTGTRPVQEGATTLEGRRRWLALYVLCFGDVLIVLDSTIVNVALPSIQADLGFSEASLAWVVNAYLLTFGGFLLLGGRLSDLFGRRRLFLIGLALFTATSLACGLAGSKEFLVVARAVQGFGGAIVSVVALSLIMTIFTDPAERAKAMGIFGFVLSGGGTAGVLLGGVLTDLFAWNWIFLVNLPIGIAVFVACLSLLPNDSGSADDRRLDVTGAVTVTAAVMLGTYAVINGNENGWTSGTTIGLLAGAVALLAVFITVEARVSSPLMPLGLFRLRNISRGERGGCLDGGIDVRLVLPRGALPPARVGLQPARGRARVPADDARHGRRLHRPFRPPGHALRHQAAARRRPDLLLDRPAPVHPGSRRRGLRRRRAPGHARHGHRRRHHLQPPTAGRHGRCRTERGRARLRDRQHGLHDGRRAGSRRAGERR